MLEPVNHTCMCAHVVLCIYLACTRHPLLSLLVLYETEGLLSLGFYTTMIYGFYHR